MASMENNGELAKTKSFIEVRLSEKFGNREHSNDNVDQRIVNAKSTSKKRIALDDVIGVQELEHAHKLEKVEAHTHECFECSECLARFELSDQLLQHLDSHSKKDKDSETVDRKTRSSYECPNCEFSLSGRIKSLLPQEARKLIGDHIIVEHFKAQLPASLLASPAPDPPEQIDHDETSNPRGIKCKFCPRYFEQVYQREVHQRYFHRNSRTKEIAGLKNTLKCPVCKSVCRSDHQLKLHREMYCHVRFECKHCNQRFPKIGLLSEHIKMTHRNHLTGAKRSQIFIPLSAAAKNTLDFSAGASLSDRGHT